MYNDLIFNRELLNFVFNKGELLLCKGELSSAIALTCVVSSGNERPE